MKIARIALLIMPLVATSVACGGAQKAMNDKGVVYYFDFDIERITGLHESDMNGYGCSSVVDRFKFEGLLSEGIKDKYNSLDVRAKVSFKDKDYFVDRAGNVRAGSDYFYLNTSELSEVIMKGSKCPS
jgi:hypothetical protein